MRPTPSAPPAERRPRRRRSRRAASPLALVAWAAVAGLLTYGQLEPAEERAPDMVELAAALDSAPALVSASLLAPAGAPVGMPLGPSAIPAPVPPPTPVLLPAVVAEPVAPPVAARPVLASAAPSRAAVAARRPSRTEPKRPFAALGQHRMAFTSPLLMPRLHLPRVLEPRFGALRGLLSRPRPGEPAAVRLSAYCLRGTTRRGAPVRTGIIAADPRVFPLGRHVELYAAGRYLGRYLVDDTGHRIKGDRIDIWTPDCDDARSFGMRDGVAALVAVGG